MNPNFFLSNPTSMERHAILSVLARKSNAAAGKTRKAARRMAAPESQPPPALDVAIVSFRCEGLLRDCLASLAQFPPGRKMTVTVVDNDSGDGTAEMVEREFPDVTLIRAPGNVGFSAANNIAMRYSWNPYLLVLNPDTRITEGALERVCAVLDANAKVGIAGAKLVREDGSLDHAAKRSFPTPVGALAHFTGVGRREDASERLSQYRAPERGDDEAGSVDAVNGAFMMIRRSVLEELGGFDEGYWMYMEDLDLCYRFDAEGWVTWYEPSAVVVHVKAGTSGPIRNPKLNRAFHYGMFRFYRKFYAPHRAPILNGLIYVGIGAKLAVSLVRAAFARGVKRSAA